MADRSISWSGYEDGANLETLIQGAIDGFTADRRSFWHEQHHGAAVVRWADKIAGDLVEAARELTEPTELDWPHSLGWDDVRELAHTEGLQELVFEKVQVAIAWSLCIGSDSKARRCLELTEDLLSEAPSEPVIRFVRRVSRCYIAGFGPECVILCRGVLENGIRDRFQCEGRSLPDTMRKRLDVARNNGWLSADGRKWAWLIWKRGSKAVHDDVEVVKDVRGTVRMTIHVLNELL